MCTLRERRTKAVTIQCDVFIDDALAPQRHQFLVIPRIGDHILLPGWEASDLAIVEQVVHIAGDAIALKARRAPAGVISAAA
jgi:hypothetical protein